MLLLLLVLLPLGGLHAGERKPAAPEAQILAAHRNGDGKRLRVLAARDEPDPWILADRLALHDEYDAAMAFARAAKRPDTARLPAYLEKRRTRGHTASLRAALERSDATARGAKADRMLVELEAQLHRGDALEQTLVGGQRGNLLLALERYDEAAEAFYTAARSAEGIGWLAMAAQGYLTAGHAAYARLAYDGLLSSWGRLRDVQQARNNRQGAALAQMFVGGVHIELGDYDRGARMIEESMTQFAELGDDDSLAWALNNVSIAYERRGEYARSAAALERAIQLARKVGNRYRLACAKVDLGSTVIEMGDHERALQLYDEGLQLFVAEEDREGIAQATGNKGVAYVYLGQYDKAVAAMESALPMYRKEEDAILYASGLNALGWALMQKGELQRARVLAEEALELTRRLRHTWYEAHALQTLVGISLRTKELKAAEQYLEQSRRVAARTDSSELQMIVHRDEAELRLAQGNVARAVFASQRSLSYALQLLAGFSPREGLQAREHIAAVYTVSLRAAQELGKPQALFTAMESARAGALLEALENREVIRAQRVPKALRRRELDARKGLKTAVYRFQEAVTRGNRKTIRTQRGAMERARGEVDQAVAQIQRAVRHAAAVLYPAPASLEEARASLVAGDALVLYSLKGTGALALVVTKETARIVKLGSVAEIEKVAHLQVDDSTVDVSEAVAAAREKLITPLALSPKTRHLLISPDGILGYVPFALLDEGRTVSYVPSGTAYRVLRRERSVRGQAVLAVGDPDYSTTTIAPPRIAERGGMRLSPLPATREEANAVGNVVLLGKAATPSAFFDAVRKGGRWHAVHLACHGLVDPEKPTRSALALAFEKDGTNLITSADIFHSRIPADLAVLSACNTGKGKIYRTEGIVGLTRSFMLAGSPRVLVSLWRVDDEATRALMIKFYELWNPKDGKKGLGAAAALKQAQVFVRTHKKWKHPYYWAAWVLWGLPD